jgi:O-antigen biosynthesis alpha-1,2-mannosyltransferase
LRIVVNALFLRPKLAGGTETYVTNILRHWYQEPCGEGEILLLANHRPMWWEGDRPWFRLRQVRGTSSRIKRIVHEQVELARESRDWDVLYSPGNVGVLRAVCPQVVTVHDAFAWVLPQEAGRLRTFYWRHMITRSVGRVAAVIAVSESTRDDLLRFTNVEPSRVRVILEAGDHVPEAPFRDDGEPSDQSRYFLAIGFFKGVKNPYRTLAAYSKYREIMLNRGAPPCRLKLVGAVLGPWASRLRDRAAAMEGVDVLGRVDDTRLNQLLSDAFGFLYASLYEGFGIPILQAQRMGCPVLTSNTGSMPEVSGEGAIFVDPLNASTMMDGMLELHRPEKRRYLARLGRENQARFSWKNASMQTLSLLQSVARSAEEPLSVGRGGFQPT